MRGIREKDVKEKRLGKAVGEFFVGEDGEDGFAFGGEVGVGGREERGNEMVAFFGA